jgi:hypothetical protein
MNLHIRQMGSPRPHRHLRISARNALAVALMAACALAQAAPRSAKPASAGPPKAFVWAAGMTFDLVMVAASKPKSPAPKTVTAAPAQPPSLVTVVSTRQGQAGYVHYFTIRGPDGVLESHVGIELADQRIAWSFPRVGVSVSPFIESGTVVAGGQTYQVEHLYGIRPFADDKSMRALQADLAARISPWIDDETGHCDPESPSNRECLSCLGFVMRVLYPGVYRHFVALPRDFKRTSTGAYSTEDLLLYLTGLQNLGTRAAQNKRLDELKLPAALREDLVRVVNAADPATDVADSGAKPRPRRAAKLPARKAVNQL